MSKQARNKQESNHLPITVGPHELGELVAVISLIDDPEQRLQRTVDVQNRLASVIKQLNQVRDDTARELVGPGYGYTYKMVSDLVGKAEVTVRTRWVREK